MLAVARSEADREFGPEGGPEFLRRTAQAVTLPDGSVDALVSSFVFQLVMTARPRCYTLHARHLFACPFPRQCDAYSSPVASPSRNGKRWKTMSSTEKKAHSYADG
jgi:hypothetical protein